MTKGSWSWCEKGNIPRPVEINRSTNSINYNIEAVTRVDDPFCHQMVSCNETTKIQITIDREDHLLKEYHHLVTKSKVC